MAVEIGRTVIVIDSDGSELELNCPSCGKSFGCHATLHHHQEEGQCRSSMFGGKRIQVREPTGAPGTIGSFFGAVPTRGRPRGTTKKTPHAGRPRAAEASPGSAASEAAQQRLLATPAPPRGAQAVRIKFRRQSYDEDPHYTLLANALQVWHAKLKSEKTQQALRMFAVTEEIPYSTLKKYVYGVRKLGTRPGKPGLLNKDEGRFVCDVLRRYDRGNDGQGITKAVDIVREIRPQLTRKQAADCFRRTIRRNWARVLSGPVKAQATTTKRTGVTVEQQYRWHMTFEEGLAELRKRNRGIGPTGQTFGELAEHFIVGGDEACIWAAEGNNIVRAMPYTPGVHAY